MITERIFKVLQVAALWLLLEAAGAGPCRRGRQYWSAALERCVECSGCDGLVVLRPCGVHQDTECGPLSALDIDWSFLDARHRPPHHRRQHNATRRHRDQLERLTWSADSIRSLVLHNASQPAPQQAFSAAEQLVWDWQAAALGLAAVACLLFFGVACAYSVHHARQWRRLKGHFVDFEADVGELSTRLSLLLPAMQPAGAAHTDNSRHCVYLEQLLAQKRQSEEGGVTGNGNVYIDRDVPSVHRG